MDANANLKRPEYMLNVEPFRQSKGMCGWASLKIVLGYNGIDFSEKNLAQLSGGPRNKGAKAADIIAVARCFGMKGVKRDYSEIKDIVGWISMDVPVIVDYFSVDDGHYAVAVGVKENRIRLQDPQIGSQVDMKIADFRRIWFDFPGKYLRSKKDLIIRRLIAIYDLPDLETRIDSTET